MARYLGWLANSVFFVLCCFFAAKTVNAVVGSTLGAGPDESSAAVQAQSALTPSWDDRQVILTRNLFNASLLAPAGALEEEDLEATQLPLTLLGTVAALEPQNAWAAIEDRDSRTTRVVKLNDELAAGATIQRIERRRVVLLENGSPRELLLASEGPSLASAAPAQRPAAATRARRRPQPRHVPRGIRAPSAAPAAAAPVEESGQNLRNAAELFSQARILPKYENGAMVGVQVNAIKPGSLFEKIGMKDGDVIKRLNGIEIDSPEESANILRELVDAKQFEAVIQNAQGTQSLSFSLPE